MRQRTQLLINALIVQVKSLASAHVRLSDPNWEKSAAHSILARSDSLQQRPIHLRRPTCDILTFRLRRSGGPYIPSWRRSARNCHLSCRPRPGGLPSALSLESERRHSPRARCLRCPRCACIRNSSPSSGQVFVDTKTSRAKSAATQRDYF
jgi:hypothetical protein